MFWKKKAPAPLPAETKSEYDLQRLQRRLVGLKQESQIHMNWSGEQQSETAETEPRTIADFVPREPAENAEGILMVAVMVLEMHRILALVYLFGGDVDEISDDWATCGGLMAGGIERDVSYMAGFFREALIRQRGQKPLPVMTWEKAEALRKIFSETYQRPFGT